MEEIIQYNHIIGNDVDNVLLVRKLILHVSDVDDLIPILHPSEILSLFSSFKSGCQHVHHLIERLSCEQISFFIQSSYKKITDSGNHVMNQHPFYEFFFRNINEVRSWKKFPIQNLISMNSKCEKNDDGVMSYPTNNTSEESEFLVHHGKRKRGDQVDDKDYNHKRSKQMISYDFSSFHVLSRSLNCSSSVYTKLFRYFLDCNRELIYNFIHDIVVRPRSVWNEFFRFLEVIREHNEVGGNGVTGEEVFDMVKNSIRNEDLNHSLFSIEFDNYFVPRKTNSPSINNKFDRFYSGFSLDENFEDEDDEENQLTFSDCIKLSNEIDPCCNHPDYKTLTLVYPIPSILVSSARRFLDHNPSRIEEMKKTLQEIPVLSLRLLNNFERLITNMFMENGVYQPKRGESQGVSDAMICKLEDFYHVVIECFSLLLLPTVRFKKQVKSLIFFKCFLKFKDDTLFLPLEDSDQTLSLVINQIFDYYIIKHEQKLHKRKQMRDEDDHEEEEEEEEIDFGNDNQIGFSENHPIFPKGVQIDLNEIINCFHADEEDIGYYSQFIKVYPDTSFRQQHENNSGEKNWLYMVHLAMIFSLFPTTNDDSTVVEGVIKLNKPNRILIIRSMVDLCRYSLKNDTMIDTNQIISPVTVFLLDWFRLLERELCREEECSIVYFINCQFGYFRVIVQCVFKCASLMREKKKKKKKEEEEEEEYDAIVSTLDEVIVASSNNFGFQEVYELFVTRLGIVLVFIDPSNLLVRNYMMRNGYMSADFFEKVVDVHFQKTIVIDSRLLTTFVNVLGLLCMDLKELRNVHSKYIIGIVENLTLDNVDELAFHSIANCTLNRFNNIMENMGRDREMLIAFNQYIQKVVIILRNKMKEMIVYSTRTHNLKKNKKKMKMNIMNDNVSEELLEEEEEQQQQQQQQQQRYNEDKQFKLTKILLRLVCLVIRNIVIKARPESEGKKEFLRFICIDCDVFRCFSLFFEYSRNLKWEEKLARDENEEEEEDDDDDEVFEEEDKEKLKFDILKTTSLILSHIGTSDFRNQNNITYRLREKLLISGFVKETSIIVEKNRMKYVHLGRDNKLYKKLGIWVDMFLKMLMIVNKSLNTSVSYEVNITLMKASSSSSSSDFFSKNYLRLFYNSCFMQKNSFHYSKEKHTMDMFLEYLKILIRTTGNDNLGNEVELLYTDVIQRVVKVTHYTVKKNKIDEFPLRYLEHVLKLMDLIRERKVSFFNTLKRLKKDRRGSQFYFFYFLTKINLMLSNSSGGGGDIPSEQEKIREGDKKRIRKNVTIMIGHLTI